MCPAGSGTARSCWAGLLRRHHGSRRSFAPTSESSSKPNETPSRRRARNNKLFSRNSPEPCEMEYSKIRNHTLSGFTRSSRATRFSARAAWNIDFVCRHPHKAKNDYSPNRNDHFTRGQTQYRNPINGQACQASSRANPHTPARLSFCPLTIKNRQNRRFRETANINLDHSVGPVTRTPSSPFDHYKVDLLIGASGRIRG